MKLQDKVAIVTGGGGGIGRAILLKLASAGARVAVCDIDMAQAERVVGELVEKHHRQAIALRVDVTQAQQVDAMVKRTLEAFGTIDILVNNAGYGRPTPSVLDLTEEQWDRSISLNLKSVFLCSKAVVKFFLDKKAGKIVNIASLAGRSTSTISGADYTAAKAGVLGFTRHLARELAPYGIQVNAVCPGPTDTQLVRGVLSQSDVDAIADRIPMRRLGRPDDVAGAVAFLLSSDAEYITGVSLDVNGGLLMM
ncbi:MAG: 3-oxoacyl-ACP reductase FabG [Candidatus Rokubacteria bacterium]|nr:3-oxoacyl-ACP reductase FabG [Candidatus Rokubacteria bacterium]